MQAINITFYSKTFPLNSLHSYFLHCCELGCKYQCSWLLGKICLRNELLWVGCKTCNLTPMALIPCESTWTSVDAIKHSVILCLFLQVGPSESSAVSKAGRNAVITSLMVCCGFIICWSPNQILFFLNFVGYSVDFSGWFYHFTRLVSVPSTKNIFQFIPFGMTAVLATKTQQRSGRLWD